MKNRFYSSRIAALVVASAVALFMAAWAPVMRAVVKPDHAALPNFDKRAIPAKAVLTPEREEAKGRLKKQLPAAQVDLDPLLATPKFIRADDGFLSGPQGQGRGISPAVARAFGAKDPHRPVKAFLNEHAALFGHGAEALANARVARESVGAHNGLRTVVWQQQLDGIPVFESVLIGNTTKDGELVCLSSQFLPDVQKAANAGVPNRKALQARPAVSSAQAIVHAARNVGVELTIGEVVSTGAPVAGSNYQPFKVRGRAAHTRLVWLPSSRESLRLCWEVYVSGVARHESFQVLIDAETAEPLVRRGLTRDISDATYNIYTSDSPSPFSPGWPTPNSTQPPLTNRVLVTLSALDPTASPDGWINDADNETRGNNTDTFLDRNFDQQPDGPRPQGNPTRVFDFPLDLTQAPAGYKDAATVQLFYLINWYHDRLYQLGFTESAGNFQDSNFGLGGVGNDHIIGYVQAGADVGFSDNAFFGTPPDGFNGEMFMLVWSGANPDRDGSVDADVVFHEATHGTSQRLVGGGVLISALQTDGMGEGWSDFYALSLLSQAGDNPDATYGWAAYSPYLLGGLTENYYYGIRHFPYCTDLLKNPFTFKDIDPAQISSHPGVPRSPLYSPFNASEADEVHHQGEVWCATLWEARANLVNRYGYPGNQLMLQVTTDGMKLGPANPNFLQARDAIILADRVNNAAANFQQLWRAFAKRGMGASATSPDSSTTAGVHEAFDLPGLGIDHVVVTGGNGNGIVEFNECNDLQIFLLNSGDTPATGVSARLSTTTPGAIIAQPVSAYPNFPSGATNANLTLFKLSTFPNFVCGTPIELTLVVKSDQETRTNQFRLNTGTVGTPIRFDNNTPVPIPDANPLGASSVITVSNITSAIGKVTVSLFVTHTFDADLKLQLISPDGLTNTLSSTHGGAGDNYGQSCAPDPTRTTFDDGATNSIGNGFPPFIGSFKPDQPLANFVGKSGSGVNGTWQLHAVDQFAIDVGTIQCWSLFLSPAVCTDGGGQCPGIDLALGMTDSPDPVFIGSNLVYTITVTNHGPDIAKGVVVNHILPSSVIFVSATPSQGTCSQAGGTLTCSLGNLSVDATAAITVVVTPTTQGLISSTASVGASEADFDLSNNSATVTTIVNPPTSDLAVGILGAPNPVLIGGTLTYTISVTNNGPSLASGVTVTSTLPATVNFISANSSQGICVNNGGTVVCSLGNLTNAGRATITINVSPTVVGTIVATARVVANQTDPIAGNNTASVTTIVGPASDLAVSILTIPNSVVTRSNFTWLITVTNRGPSAATAVLINDTLPAGITLISSNASQGSISRSGNTITCSAGTLANGASATLTLVLTATNSGLYSTTASVTGSEADPDTANNTATVTTQVAAPFVSIVAAGATLTAESISPPNGAVEPGETVTVQFRLRNAGNVGTSNLVATLQASGGVTSPSSSQSYTNLAASGLPVGRAFTFTAAGTNGGVIVATLQLQDGATNLGTVNFTFALPNVTVFSNSESIIIPENGAATPYPSTINVSGLTGVVGKVTVSLVDMNHTFPDDVDILLVGPAGKKTILMSDAGGPVALTNVTVTFDSAAASAVPNTGPITSASFQPADYEPGDLFDEPAPTGPYGAALSVFDGANPNATWSLYVVDDTGGDAGSIAGGWSMVITTITPVNQVADLLLTAAASPNPVLAGNNLTYTFTITNGGPNAATGVAFTNVLPGNVAFVSASSPQGSCSTNGGAVVCNLGSLNPGATGSVTVVVVPSASAAGLLVNSATVAASEIDLNLANNSASVGTTVSLPVVDLAVTKLDAPNPVVIGSNLTYTVTVTNNGPQTALSAVISDPLPAGTAFVSANSTVGSCSTNSGIVTCNLGNLSSGSAATITIVVTATSIGTLTNVVTATTTSSDTNAANNSATTITTVTPPLPIIVAAGSTLVSESFAPANGTIDSGETVTVSLTLSNAGAADTANLVAMLQATGGVTPGSAQNYGALVHGGATASRPFTFTASGTNGGVIVATLQLHDGPNNFGSVTFAFSLPNTATFANTAAITIPNSGTATPYPSTIVVSGLTGLVSKVTATLNGVTHAFPDDVDILLVGPLGQKLALMSDTGGGHGLTNLTLTFDDSAAASLPDSAQISSGTFKPTDYETGDNFPAPAPAGPVGTTLSVFNGAGANGTWSLYVVDDSTGDAGTIAGGWSLSLTTVTTVNPAANLAVAITDSPDPVFVFSPLTYTVKVTNQGPATATGVQVTDALPSGVTFGSATASQGSCSNNGGVVTCNLGSLAAGANATATIIVTPITADTAINTASVAGNETDLDPVNNSAQTTTAVLNPIAAVLTGSSVTANGQFQLTLTGQPGVTYYIDASTNLASWVRVGTNTAAANGTFKFTDTAASNFVQRYYRSVRVP